ncbi:ABC transporter ATP-binding protein [Candidatus Lariskella endosymbiont of Epinotia ramella]|uniref:ABC transporter ATP-binding protein n=1 Tax=Candidatus Lariskella endosymbiont of Epinotia ramella TaxID=3066224 RepID=UPI0030CA7013
MHSRVKIEVKGLNKTFGANHVLKNIDLDIRYEESLAVIGGSGSGKSVLLRCIAGLFIPDDGSSVTIDHEIVTYKHISQRTSFAKKFGMLFQNGALFDSLPIWQNVAFGLLRVGKFSKDEARKIAVDKLTMVELNSNIIDLYPSELSGGMQKRVALARAIATEPEIIFFDEPTSGLDPITARSITKLIKDLARHLHATTVIITHDMFCMRNISDKVAVIKDGQIIWHGNIADIEKVQNSYIQDFIAV